MHSKTKEPCLTNKTTDNLNRGTVLYFSVVFWVKTGLRELVFPFFIINICMCVYQCVMKVTTIEKLPKRIFPIDKLCDSYSR